MVLTLVFKELRVRDPLNHHSIFRHRFVGKNREKGFPGTPSGTSNYFKWLIAKA